MRHHCPYCKTAAGISAPSIKTRCMPLLSEPKPESMPGTTDRDLPKIADDVEQYQKARDHAIMTMRASSSEIAWRSPSTSIVTGPPSGAFSTTRKRTPGRTPTCPK